ncbi:MAG: GGDEF domain-containing protein [Lachnospiraceae bacterium]|nr:GGDEF domain-containing protein [Lachnospiraceae bacterium]
MDYKIAFFMHEWNHEIANSMLRGIKKYVTEHDSVAVHVFDSMGNFGTDDVDNSDFQIFNLPYVGDYDGIIIEGNRGWSQEKRQELANRAINKGKPVVALNHQLDGCIYMGTDNASAMRAIVDHVIEVHGAKNMAFVRGAFNSKEARDRELAFRSSCEAHGIDEYDTTYYGNSWTKANGTNAAKSIYSISREDGEKLPDAVICANDASASGVIEYFKEHGVSVPEDVIVTGFDNALVAKTMDPRITTVDRDYARQSYLAVQTVIAQLQPSAGIVNRINSPSELILGKSCGCSNGLEDLRKLTIRYQNMNACIRNFTSVQSKVSPYLGSSDNLYEALDVIEKCAPDLEAGNMYLVINGMYMDYFEYPDSVRHYGKVMHLMACSDNKLKCDTEHIYTTFDRKTLLPDDIINQLNMVTFYPLKLGSVCIGYVAMTEFSKVPEFDILEGAFNLYDNLIESVRQSKVLSDMNQKLAPVYMTDQKTGMVNRFGIQFKAKQLFDEMLEEGTKVYISYIDIDNMRMINEKYGYENGDNALRTTAKLIKKCIGNIASMGIRYGADEFVTITDHSIRDELMEDLENLKFDEAFAYPYNLTIGEVTVVQGDGQTLQNAIDAADDQMFNLKKKKRS